VAPWGWTWIDDAAWGFAPYHYGRWVYVRDRWGWIPGPRDLRPVYAPALVAFVGGSGWSASVGIGPPIGWFPLGPYDFYDPWYPVGIGYYRRVNWRAAHWDRHDRDGRQGYEQHFNEHWQRYREGRPEVRFSDRRPPHGITAMSRDAFAQARPVQVHRLRVDPARLQGATVAGGGNRLPPARVSGERGRAAPAHVQAGFERSVVMHHGPAGLPGEAGRAGAFRDAGARPAAPTRMASPAPTNRVDRSDRYPTEHRYNAQAPSSGLLPAVPRVVQAPPSARPAEIHEQTAPREARSYPPPGVLPTTPRIQNARPAEPDRRSWSTAEPRVTHAPAERSMTAPPARFEVHRVPTPEAAPAVTRRMEAPARAAPQAPRQYVPAPQPAPAAHESRQSQPAEGKKHENPGAERGRHH